jgi:hypothetical protein
MKKRILYGISVIVIVAVAAVNVNLGKQKNMLSSVALDNIEALADEYTIGFPVSTWKTYTIECTYTYGINYIVVLTTSFTTQTKVCGYGTGWCLPEAGC